MQRFWTAWERLFGPGPAARLWPRWLFLRGLALIFISAFYSWIRQVQGLMGPSGILPASNYLHAVAQHFGMAKGLWLAPSLFWLGSGAHTLSALCIAGLIASMLLLLNFWPRACLAVCEVCYISLLVAAQDFSSYQSDGMLLEAGLISFFLAPPGLRPGLGERQPPSRASYFLLQWLWFRIYFESGLVKMLSGEPQWRDFTAMDHYYENGPLPNWIGWYAQQLPHWFHAATAFFTLVTELGLAWMLFLGRRLRIICFYIVSCFQIGIILTANLAFINHLALLLGVLLLDDRYLRPLLGRIVPTRDTSRAPDPERAAADLPTTSRFDRCWGLKSRAGLIVSGILLAANFYVTTALLLEMLMPSLPLPSGPIVALEPFRIANQYGLFAVMTRARYEIEFQGSRDGGKSWLVYPFRYKPQDPRQAPRIYAPYQPRFDWNLWFASLGGWREYPWVVNVEVRLLENSPAVRSLFAKSPFDGQPPTQVRAVEWRYWFTDRVEKREYGGLWWHREYRGLYAPMAARDPNGQIAIIAPPEEPAQQIPELQP
jgi:hypothetical protein